MIIKIRYQTFIGNSTKPPSSQKAKAESRLERSGKSSLRRGLPVVVFSLPQLGVFQFMVKKAVGKMRLVWLWTVLFAINLFSHEVSADHIFPPHAGNDLESLFVSPENTRKSKFLVSSVGIYRISGFLDW